MRLIGIALASILALAPLGAGAQGISTQRISGKRISILAAHELSTVSLDPDQDLVQESMVPDQIVQTGRVDLHAGTPVGNTSFINVPVEIDVDGREDRTVMVGYRVQQYVQTAVASHDLLPGTVLASEDLTIGRVPYTGQAANGIDALVGRKILSASLKGSPITIQETAVNQIVQAGSTVVFIVRDSGVAVTADAVARTSGGLGDEVFVYNPMTHKALSGTVTAPGTVELDISGGDQ